MHALSVATVVALSSTFAAPALAQQARINLSGLQADTGNDRFIVKYKDGSAARSNATTAHDAQQRRGPAGGGKARGPDPPAPHRHGRRRGPRRRASSTASRPRR